MDEISNILQGGNLHGSSSFLQKSCINYTVGNVTFGPVGGGGGGSTNPEPYTVESSP